ERVFQDAKSGRNVAERLELSALLGHVRQGDTVRVASMDRLGRSVVDLAKLVTGLIDRGVRVEFVKERLTFDAEATDFMTTFQLHLMDAFAQMERTISNDGQREGIDLSRAQRAYLGRAKRLTDADIDEARRLVGQGVSKAVVPRSLECSRHVSYDALNARGAYAPAAVARPLMVGGAQEVPLPLPTQSEWWGPDPVAAYEDCAAGSGLIPHLAHLAAGRQGVDSACTRQSGTVAAPRQRTTHLG
ncbi:MAG: recombinase family protein, partial [Allobranchiibius sp.]